MCTLNLCWVAAAGSIRTGMGLKKYVGERIAFSLTSSESDVKHWKVRFREPRRLALLWGLGVAKRGAGGLPAVRQAPERAVAAGGSTRTGMVKKNAGCGQGRIASSLTGSES